MSGIEEVNEQIEESFAASMERHRVEWECDGRYLTILTFPEGATIVPDDLERLFVEQYVDTYPVSLAWSKKTGWVGLASCVNEPIAWYIQNESKHSLPAQLKEIKEKFVEC